ncbi:phospholipase [Diaminobutyricibacter tongyongensis]|uniref:Phospholipase n=1 Tax=Leifsonia tongyongensis TaxID=1268043 RepID=A0A6L9XTC0_9MICO|nr:phospholipase [Diaminobutyricibacter tongyongensis]
MPTSPPALRIDREAVLWSASEIDRADRPLLILLHGYGSDEGDLFGISSYLPLEPVIASVRAPIPEGPGFAWFSRYSNAEANPSPTNANAAAMAVLEWLDEQPPHPSVGLLGFSQGGAMALQLLRLAPERFGYAVQLSGFAVSGEEPGDVFLATHRPPVFWGRGSADDTITPDAIARTTDWLPSHSTLDSRVYEGLTHAISPRELTDVSGFIRHVL